jgi:hypothetical protein
MQLDPSRRLHILGTKDMAARIGKRGSLATTDGLRIDVVIEDVRQRYGHTDYHVRPVSGTGTTWVESTRVREVK